jgi:hypothetical protein
LLLLYLHFFKCAGEGVHNACYVKSARLRVPESLRALFLVSGFTAALLLLYCCFTAALLRVQESLRAPFLVSGFAAALLLLYCCFTQEFQSVASQ